MSSSFSENELLKALGIGSAFTAALKADTAAFMATQKTETDRGSRFETLSYDGSMDSDSDSDMPPLEPAFKTPPPLKRCNAIAPPVWPKEQWAVDFFAGTHLSRDKTELRFEGCGVHEGLYNEHGNKTLGRSTTSGGIEPTCSCDDVKRTLDWGAGWGGAAAPAAEVIEPPIEVPVWGPEQLTELQGQWTERLLAIRDEQHAHDINHLVDYIFDNNTYTLADELKMVMANAKSPRDLKVAIYTYNHTTPNGDDLRWKAYEDSDGEVHSTLQQFLHKECYETTVPGGDDDVHWLVKKTSLLKRIAERFGAANFTASYKLVYAGHIDDRITAFYSTGTIWLHFWPNGVRTAA